MFLFLFHIYVLILLFDLIFYNNFYCNFMGLVIIIRNWILLQLVHGDLNRIIIGLFISLLNFNHFNLVNLTLSNLIAYENDEYFIVAWIFIGLIDFAWLDHVNFDDLIMFYLQVLTFFSSYDQRMHLFRLCSHTLSLKLLLMQYLYLIFYEYFFQEIKNHVQVNFFFFHEITS